MRGTCAAVAIAIAGFASGASHAGEAKRGLTLEAIFASDAFRGRSVDNVQWDQDGKSFTFSRENPRTGLVDVHRQQLTSGKEQRLVAGEALKWNGVPVRSSGGSWTRDRRHLLFAGPMTRTWNGQMEASFFVFDAASGSVRPLAGGALRHVMLSPDSRRVGDVRANNIYVAELTDLVPRPITSDGSPGIFNGIFDYGSSEFGGDAAWVWSPDGKRLGFWGWSGGGYLAAALMTKGAGHFKAAVSVAPVIDLSRYQSVGVERWMGQLAENPQGYAAVNLINFADRLQGKLLLIHGTGDENVEYGFTLQFADALVRANKQFDMMIYPNQHHALSEVQLHVFTKITEYFRANL